MAYAILPALMLCMYRFFNKINNVQILLHNIRISLHVGNTHPIIVSAINNKVLLLLILRKYLNLYLIQSVFIFPLPLLFSYPHSIQSFPYIFKNFDAFVPYVKQPALHKKDLKHLSIFPPV